MRVYLVENIALINATFDGKKNGVPQRDRNPNDITRAYMQYSINNLSFLIERIPLTINATKNKADITLLTPKARFTEFIDLNAVDKSITISNVHIPITVEIIIRFPCLYEAELYTAAFSLLFCFAIFS